MIGERLYDLRKEANLTQEDLGKILNINKHSISSYERNKSEPSDDIKIKIATFFGVSVDYLVGISNEPIIHNEEKNYIRFPANFPAHAKEQIKDYVNYLTLKYSG